MGEGGLVIIDKEYEEGFEERVTTEKLENNSTKEAETLKCPSLVQQVFYNIGIRI